jgi:hypothetical protein
MKYFYDKSPISTPKKPTRSTPFIPETAPEPTKKKSKKKHLKKHKNGNFLWRKRVTSCSDKGLHCMS